MPLARRLIAESENRSFDAVAALTPYWDELIDCSFGPVSDDEAYGRHVLHSTSDLEIMVAGWGHGAECAPHDHGYAKGCVIALSGSFSESEFEFIDNRFFVKINETRVSSPARMPVHYGHIHSMKSHSRRGVTLHIYSPAISEMKVFDRGSRQTLVVSEECGAWMPKEHQIHGVQKWRDL